MNKPSNVYFFNNYHNGDVFYSKEFIKDIKNKLGINHYYCHNNDFSILKDVDVDQIRKYTPHNDTSVIQIGDDLYINTWIGQQNFKYLTYGCSLKSNYILFCDIYNQLNISINPMEFYIPTVDFQKIETKNIDNFIQSNKRYVLVCNNSVWSGQSENFDFDPIIDYLSNIYPNITFIMTNDSFLQKSNIITVNNILNYSNNLLEISYLSTKVDVIIGRASGPFCFTHIKENMENPNKIFICFSYYENESKWILDKNCQAKQYWSNIFDDLFIRKYLKNILQKFKIVNKTQFIHQKKIFLSFADSRMQNSLDRIERQAKEMNYDVISIYNEKDLNKDFVNRFKNNLIYGSRGFGYWCWKPQIILQELDKMNNNDILLYSDVGCHINKNGYNRLLEYFDIANKNDILAFQGKSLYDVHHFLECEWAKGDVLDYFNVRHNKEIIETSQIGSGIIFIKKCNKSINIITQWLNSYYNNFSLSDDSPSISPNLIGFIENRSQSIFSIICKLNNIKTLSYLETWNEDWKLLDKYPILAKRDKDII
jgi:hypothetical protein